MFRPGKKSLDPGLCILPNVMTVELQRVQPSFSENGMETTHLPLFFTVTLCVFAASVFGSVIVRTPSLHSAWTLSSLIAAGRVIARANEPLRRSMR